MSRSMSGTRPAMSTRPAASSVESEGSDGGWPAPLRGDEPQAVASDAASSAIADHRSGRNAVADALEGQILVVVAEVRIRVHLGHRHPGRVAAAVERQP